MPAKHITNNTSRRILKVVSLGLAALIAGLLAGCMHSPKTVSANPYRDLYNADQFYSANLPSSLDATSMPPLHNAPSPRRLDGESVQLTQATVSFHGS
mgnify:FL=1|jgi:hypothetical protein